MDMKALIFYLIIFLEYNLIPIKNRLRGYWKVEGEREGNWGLRKLTVELLELVKDRNF